MLFRSNVGHELSIKVVRKLASQRKADHFIFVSSIQDAKKNPLEINKKIQYLGNLFPNTKFVQKEIDQLGSVLKKYKTVYMVVAADSIDYYKKLLKKIGITDVEFVKAGSSCPDEDDKLIKLASKGEYQSFKTSLPTTVRELDGKRLMNDIRIGLNLEPIKEQINLVKDDLREQYFRGEIFNEGNLVECNDVVYKIVKRGSNHLLLQNEKGLKVSKWIQDVKITEREFMLKETVADTSKVKFDLGAERERKIAELKANQAKAKEDLQKRQDQESATLKQNLQTQQNEAVDSPVVDKKSKYNIAKSLMSLNDFRKTMNMGVKGVDQKAMDDKETESDLDSSEHATSSPTHTQVGGNHMSSGGDHNLRRMRVNYHLGEGNGYDDNRTGFAKKEREDDEYHNEPKPKFKAKSTLDRPHTVHIDGKPWKKFSNGNQANAAAKTLQAKGKNVAVIAHFSEEQIDELSKTTLGNYIKANKADTVDRASSDSFKSGKAGDVYNKADETHKDKMRSQGMDRAVSKLTKEETEEQQDTRKMQLKRFKDQAAGAKLSEAQYAGLEKEDKPGKIKTAVVKTHPKAVEVETVEGWKDEKKPVKEEFDDINEEELIAQVEADLDALTEDAFYEAYDDEELAIIDDETGEEIEAVAEEAEFDTEMIMEVLSRIERIRAKARMRRSAAKRQRREKIALRQLSTPEVANRRARRMAISALKKRLLRGQNPQKVSVGQKERMERFIQQRRKLVDRLATRMVSRVKQVEKARMAHKKFTKPNNGVSF